MLDVHHSADTLERLRAALDLQTIDIEEALAAFGVDHIDQSLPLVGVDVDPVIGLILVQYEPKEQMAYVMAQRYPNEVFGLHAWAPGFLRSEYDRSKQALRAAITAQAKASAAPH